MRLATSKLPCSGCDPEPYSLFHSGMLCARAKEASAARSSPLYVCVEMSPSAERASPPYACRLVRVWSRLFSSGADTRVLTPSDVSLLARSTTREDWSSGPTWQPSWSLPYFHLAQSVSKQVSNGGTGATCALTRASWAR